MECFCTALSRSVSFYNNLLNWLCGLIVRVRVVPRGLLLVIVTDVSKILTDVIIRVTWCTVSCLVPDWPIFTRRVDLKNQVVWVGGYGLVSILGRGFRVESLRSVLLSNEFLLISVLLYTLNWKSIAQEKYEPWKLNSGKQFRRTTFLLKVIIKEKLDGIPSLFFLMVIRIQNTSRKRSQKDHFIWCQLHL